MVHEAEAFQCRALITTNAIALLITLESALSFYVAKQTCLVPVSFAIDKIHYAPNKAP